MFTGIISQVQPVEAFARAGESAKLRVPSGFENICLGESIAVNGVCLTVTETYEQTGCVFDLSIETLEKSNLQGLQTGVKVNLERALCLGDSMSGHLVQGHVDGLALLERFEDYEEYKKISIRIPETLSRYCVEKGSIAINGVSLTINQIENNLINIMLVPHTWRNTNFSTLDEGALLNIETDMMAKYVEKLCQPYKPL